MSNYIEMCELKELQKLWEPKVGDWFAEKGSKEGREAKKFLYLGTGSASEYLVANRRGLYLWLPSEEDLWELLPEGKYDLHDARGWGDMANWYVCEEDEYDENKIFEGDIAKQALLQAVVWERWQKTWKGEWR